MITERPHAGNARALRKQAEDKVRDMGETTPAEQSPEEIRRMLHELRVHQIELEMQNEELLRTQTELDAAKVRYFDLYDLAPIGYCTVSDQGLILEINLTGAILLRMNRSEIVGQSISRFILKEDQDIYYHLRKQLIETAKLQSCELRMVRKDDMVIWSNLTAIEGHESDGTTVHRIVVKDITEHKQAEKEKRNLAAQLQHAQKMEAIGILAGGIAHDFNNILGAILGYAEMIRDDFPTGSTGVKDINQVLKAGHRAKELVKQILAFSRQVEANNIPMQPATIVKEAIKMLRSSLPTTISIQQEIDSEAGVILANPSQIHQIVMNLCTNAFHAMEIVGGTLTISLKKKVLTLDDLGTELHMQPGNFVQLSFRDTGTGIAPEIKEKIFEPYFTTKEVGKGTGMGLDIVHGIVQSYGGSIVCECLPKEGTVFHILLPIIEEDALRESETAEQLPLGKEHILLVDDEETLVEMGTAMLERLGYRVTARMNSLEALSTFEKQSNSFDMVITDQTMPGMTGIDLARRILQMRPEMPIILCTGHSSLISEEQVKSLGIKGFAMKPMAQKEIAGLIRRILDDGKSADET